MGSPNKPSGTGPQSRLAFGSREAGSKNGQSELRFNCFSRECDDLETGTGPGSGSHTAAASSLSADLPDPTPGRGELWTRRLTLALFVVVCVWSGLILVVLPWTHAWTDNGLLIRNLALRSFASQNFVRGVVSGLGLVNVWMGIWEAVHYREPHKKAT